MLIQVHIQFPTLLFFWSCTGMKLTRCTKIFSLKSIIGSAGLSSFHTGEYLSAMAQQIKKRQADQLSSTPGARAQPIVTCAKT